MQLPCHDWKLLFYTQCPGLLTILSPPLPSCFQSIISRGCTVDVSVETGLSTFIYSPHFDQLWISIAVSMYCKKDSLVRGEIHLCVGIWTSIQNAVRNYTGLFRKVTVVDQLLGSMNPQPWVQLSRFTVATQILPTGRPKSNQIAIDYPENMSLLNQRRCLLSLSLPCFSGFTAGRSISCVSPFAAHGAPSDTMRARPQGGNFQVSFLEVSSKSSVQSVWCLQQQGLMYKLKRVIKCNGKNLYQFQSSLINKQKGDFPCLSLGFCQVVSDS